MVAIVSPSPYGFKFRGYKTGASYISPFFRQSSATQSTTSTRIYYTPFPVLDAATASFNRCYTYNQGAGDNGDTYRTGVYADDGTLGPGTLILDFGEVTLTGAAALRTQTISLDLTARQGQIVWLAFHANQSAAMHDMRAQPATTEVAELMAPLHAPLFGSIARAYNSADVAQRYIWTVDTTYGALASTAVAPTAQGDGAAPLIALGKA